MSYANYLYIAIRAAVDAGKSIMDIYNDPESDFGIERKADNSPLTKADKAVSYTHLSLIQPISSAFNSVTGCSLM